MRPAALSTGRRPEREPAPAPREATPAVGNGEATFLRDPLDVEPAVLRGRRIFGDNCALQTTTKEKLGVLVPRSRENDKGRSTDDVTNCFNPLTGGYPDG